MNRNPLDKTEKTEEGASSAHRPEGRMAASSAETKEEADYADVAAPPDQSFLLCTQSFPPIAVCWLTLLVIMGLRIYSTPVSEPSKHLPLSVTAVTSVISEDNAQLTAENQQLKTLMQHLNLSNEKSLLAAVRNLTSLNNKLTSENENLRRDRNNLTVQLYNLTQNLESNHNELNVSRAQWSVDAYCPKENHVSQCRACQDGWIHTQSSCYAVVDPNPPERETWEEAREDCRGKTSHLAVVHDQEERNLISDYSWQSSDTDGYWIGLRAEGGRWKWVDGSYMTFSSWIEAPTDGRCAVSVQSRGWKSVSCEERQRWICEKKALSV